MKNKLHYITLLALLLVGCQSDATVFIGGVEYTPKVEQTKE